MSDVIVRISDIESQSRSRPDGYYDEVMSSGVRLDDHVIRIPLKEYKRLAAKYGEKAESGPGTELSVFLKKWLGIAASPGCSCAARARLMDEWGADECERRMPEIVGWLEEEARNRGLPFVRFAAEQAVKLAVRKARKNAAQ